MKKLFILVFVFLFTFIPKASAQSAWTIPYFTSNIALLSDGRVQIVETINVDFNSLEKHGIYRDIPYVYKDDQGKKTYTEIAIQSVQQDNERAKYTTSQNESHKRVKIGEASRTISGKHTYRIEYTATGILRTYHGYDELYWNVTGNEWEADIKKVVATVTIPKNRIQKVACFEGYAGSQGECSAKQNSERQATFTNTDVLSTAKGITIVMGYIPGTVPILTVEPPKQLQDEVFTSPALLAFGLTLVWGIGFVISMWLRNGRDFWYKTPQILDQHAKGEVRPMVAHETTIVAFEPPAQLRPAEVGVLIDERADTLDITATLIDLATRGYITITEIPKKWLFGSSDYELTKINQTKSATKKQSNNDLLPYETMLLNRLFTSGDRVKLSTLKTEFYDDLAQIKKQLYHDIETKGLFVSNPETTRMKYLGLGFGIDVIAAGLLVLGVKLVHGPIFNSGIAVILVGLIAMIVSNFMPRRTAKGRELYRQTKGYRMFVGGAEKYRQQFFEKKNLFNEILPYAIVFGLTDKFAKAMKDMGIATSQPSWYSGTRPFNTSYFVSDISNFSKSLSSAITSTPSKSGGFSGGSSGGGFGGGGGGSW
jgi:uncharacterized membrane protein